MDTPSKPRMAMIVTVPGSIRSFYLRPLEVLVRAGFEVVVICAPDATLQAELPAGCRFVPIQMTRVISPWRDLCALWRLYRVLRRERCDLVQYSTPKASLLGCVAAAAARVPIRLFMILGAFYSVRTGVRGSLYVLLDRFMCWLSTHIVTNSRGLIDLIENRHVVPRSRCTVIWNGSTCGIDLAEFDPPRWQTARGEIRSRLGIPEGDVVIGAFGRLTREKGVNELVAAFLRIAQHSAHVFLLLVGVQEDKDPLAPETQEAIRTHPRIRYLGWQPSLPPFYAAVDIFCLPSYREGLGQTVLEAQAMERPCVCSDIMGCRETIENQRTGYLAAPQSADALIPPLEKLIADRELRRMMGRSGRERIARMFDARDVLAAIAEHHLRLLGEARKRRL